MNPSIVILLLILASTVVCYFVAKQRGAKVSYWVALGVVLGPLAIPFVFMAKPDSDD